jgi:hypothetical protein
MTRAAGLRGRTEAATHRATLVLTMTRLEAVAGMMVVLAMRVVEMQAAGQIKFSN